MFLWGKAGLLRYNLRSMQFTYLKCTMQWLLVYSQICATINTSILKHLYHLRKKQIGGTQDIYSSETIPYSTGCCDGGYMSECIECITPRVNPKYKLWAEGSNDQCMFTYCNRCTLLGQMLIMGEAVHACGRGYMGKERNPHPLTITSYPHIPPNPKQPIIISFLVHDTSTWQVARCLINN